LHKDKLIQELFQKIEVLTFRLEQAEREIAELKQENAELKARLNSNSNNSSKPPFERWLREKASISKNHERETRGPIGASGQNIEPG
jgi:cell division protein FtsB